MYIIIDFNVSWYIIVSMKQINSIDTLSLESKWFHVKSLGIEDKVVTLIVSDEVLEHSFHPKNADIESIVTDVIVPTIKNDPIWEQFYVQRSNIQIILAHGSSTQEKLEIFWTKLGEWENIESILSYFKNLYIWRYITIYPYYRLSKKRY